MTGSDRDESVPPDAQPPLPVDETPEVPPSPAGETAEVPPAPADETAPVPPPVGPSGTAVLPPVPEEVPAPPDRPRWAGRAAVPPPPTEAEEYREPWLEQPRSVAIPVLITVCVMLLLGVFALGIWLIVDNRPSPGPSLAPSPSLTTPSSAPTSAPTSATPTSVLIPTVTDLDYDEAAEKLEGLGLVPERREVFDEAEAGTVLGTDPPAGTRVDVGTHVAIQVSIGPEPPPTTQQPTAPPSSAQPTQ